MTIEESFNKNYYKNFYLFYGNQDYLIVNYKNKFKKLINYPELNLYEFDDMIDINTLHNIIMSNPMLSEKKLVIIDYEDFSKKINNTYFELFNNISPNTILIIIERDIDKKSSLFKFVEKNGVVTECKTLDASGLKSVAERYFKSNKIQINKAELSYFVEKVGISPDINMMINEANKLINYCIDDGSITMEAIDKICITSLENKVFDMIKAQVRKDFGRLEKLYADLYNLKEDPRKIFALLKDQYLKIISVKSLENLSKTDVEIKKILNINYDWALRNLKLFSKRFETARLEFIIDRISALELKIKTSSLSPTSALEILIFNV